MTKRALGVVGAVALASAGAFASVTLGASSAIADTTSTTSPATPAITTTPATTTAAATTTAPAAAKPTKTHKPRKTGYVLLIHEGFVCTRTPRACRYIPFAHALATVLRNNHVVARAKLNAQGRASVLVKSLPGQYAVAATGTLNGRPLHLRVHAPRPIAGLMLPFTVNICPPGAFC